jgi:hypothetical protein
VKYLTSLEGLALAGKQSRFRASFIPANPDSRLIAIMLGRLEMDVDECIIAYSDLAAAVFSEKSSRMPITINGKIKPRFDSAKLEIAIQTVLKNNGAAETDLMNDGNERGCRT